MQANGSEMLRVAVIMAEEAGIEVIGTVHDALLIQSSIEEIEQDSQATMKIMGDASEFILQGFRLRSDVEIVRYPDRYFDERGEKMWDTIVRLLEDHEVGDFGAVF